MDTRRQQVHLLIVVHGLWGNPSHVATVAKVIRERHAELAAAAHPDEHIDLDILVPESNADLMTYDGIDWCAERVVKEIMYRKREIEEDGSRTVTKFSAFGYSLGGLKARYAVGILHAQGFFKTIEPVNFCTFATPHIGLLRDGSFWRRFLEFWGTKLLSRSGKQLFARDKWSPDGQPLLAVLADKDRLFYKALTAFKNIHFYANGVKDMTVPFYTGHISTHDPFLNHTESGIEVVFDEKYAPILKSYALPAVPPPPPPPKPWYQRFKPRLPPFIRNPIVRGFIYVFFPVLVPLVMMMVIVRFSLATHASQKRIRILERDSMGETRLVQMLRELEQGMDNAVADMVDQPGAADPEALRAATAHKSGVEFDVHDADARVESPEPGTPGVATRPHRKGEGIFTPMHRRMAANLNGIRHLQKHIAFIPEYANAHAVIVVRDPVQFDWHHKGLGVIRHWADGFDF